MAGQQLSGSSEALSRRNALLVLVVDAAVRQPVGQRVEEAWMETLRAVLVSVGLVVGGLLPLAMLMRMADLGRRDSRRPRRGRRFGRRRRDL